MPKQLDNSPRQPAEYDQSLIPEPAVINPGYVRSTYLLPDGITPDYEKNLADGVTMQQRLDPQAGPQTRFGLVETGLQFNTYAQQWDGISTKHVNRARIVEGEYWVSRKLASAVFIGSALAFNLIGNSPTIAGIVQRVVYDVQDHTRSATEIVPVVTQGKPRRITETILGSSAAGQATADKAAVTSFVSELHKAELMEGVITAVRVTGTASDEDARQPSSIGHPDKSNQMLATDRAKTAVSQLQSGGLDFPTEKIKQAAHEQVLENTELIQVLETEAKQQGYPDLLSAIKHANVGDKLAPVLARDIYDNFTGPNARGVTFSADVIYPGAVSIDNISTAVQVSDRETLPHIPYPSFYWFIPLLPIRKRAWHEESQPQLSWVGTKHDLYLPQLVREKDNKVFMHVYDDGVNNDGSLKSQALWHTDKFEYLLREENRLQDMIRLDLTDIDDKPQTIRALFVDVQPGEDERSVFQDELTKAALFNNGKLAEVVDTIVVYPSEYAGVMHQDPSRVGPGQEHQLSENILGVYNPVLKLIEIVMPTTWAAEDMQQLFQSFYGPKGILRHELGHAVCRKDETYTARGAKVIGGARTYVLSVTNRNTSMETLMKQLKPLQPADPKLQFDIQYRVADENDKQATIEDRVTVNSKQLAHADRVQIVDSQVVPRARVLLKYQNAFQRRLAAEEFADSFAGLTGKGVPFRAAGIEIPKTKLQDGMPGIFSRWILPSTPVQSLIECQAVAEVGIVPLQPMYDTNVTVTRLKPSKDLLIGSQMTRARQAHSLDGRQQVTYLTEVNYAESPELEKRIGNDKKT